MARLRETRQIQVGRQYEVGVLVEPWVARSEKHENSKPYAGAQGAHNSWMILSKLMTANSREAIAAAAMVERVRIRRRDAEFDTVAGEKEGRGMTEFAYRSE